MADSEQALELEELLPSRVGGAGGVDSDSDRPLSPQEPGKRRGPLATRNSAVNIVLQRTGGLRVVYYISCGRRFWHCNIPSVECQQDEVCCAVVL